MWDCASLRTCVCVRACMYVYARVCLCVCVCVWRVCVEELFLTHYNLGRAKLNQSIFLPAVPDERSHVKSLAKKGWRGRGGGG